MKPFSYTHEQLIDQARFTSSDLVQIQQCRRDHNSLGFGYQLAFVRLLNRFPIQQPFEIVEEILDYVSIQLSISTADIAKYNRRQKTISEHQERIRQYLGLKRFSQVEYDRADGQTALATFVFEQACRLEQTHALMARVKAFLRQQRILEPADFTLERLIQRKNKEDK